LPPIVSHGWVIVSEFDDHPNLIAGVTGEVISDDAWNAVRLTHAVQTSTPLLRETFRSHNPEVAAFENAAFSIVPDAVEPRADGSFRVFFGALNRGRV
jgi:hypothetical protein